MYRFKQLEGGEKMAGKVLTLVIGFICRRAVYPVLVSSVPLHGSTSSAIVILSTIFH